MAQSKKTANQNRELLLKSEKKTFVPSQVKSSSKQQSQENAIAARKAEMARKA